MRTLLPVVFLAMLGCPTPEPPPNGPPDPPDPVLPETGDTGQDTGTMDTGGPEPIDPNGPITDTCPNASAAFAALDLETAKTEYDACIAADADNGGAYLGLAMVELLTMSDGAVFVDALGRCGETNTFVDDFFGANGELRRLGEEFGGQSALDVDFVGSSGSVDLTVLDDPRVVLSTVDDRYVRDGDYTYTTYPPPPPELRESLEIEIASSVTYANELRLLLDTQDVYQDGTNVALADGLVIDMQNLPSSAVSVYLDCNQPGSTCTGWQRSNFEPSGTITVVSYGDQPGAIVDLDVDIRVPSFCAAACMDRYAIIGDLTDTVTGDYDTAWLPFDDATPPCEDQRCDYRTEAYTTVADLCTVEDHLTINQIAQDVADDLQAVGDAFAAAAAKAGRHEMRFDNVFVVGEPVPFGVGEARAFASFLHAGAAAARLASSYDVMDPNAVPADLTVDYVADDYVFTDEPDINGKNEGQCAEVDYYGLPLSEVADQMRNNVFAVSSVADFAGARAGLLEAFTELRSAIGSGTGETELYDFAYAQTWAVDVISDLDVLIASLQGTDGQLATASGWQVTLDAYFDAPTDRTTLLGQAYGTDLLGLDDGYCEDELFFDEGAATWMSETGFGALTIPESALNGYGSNPVLLDEDRWLQLEDPLTGEPIILMEPLLEIFR